MFEEKAGEFVKRRMDIMIPIKLYQVVYGFIRKGSLVMD